MAGNAIKRKYIFNFILFFYVVILVTSCKTKQLIVKPEKQTPDTISALIQKIQMQAPQFYTANISKMSMSFNYGSRNVSNMSAGCRLKRDTAIFLSVQPVFGIELFSVEISPDSICVIDKFNRRYFSATYQYIKQKTGAPMNFNNLQAMFSNSFFLIGEKDFDAAKCKTEITDQKVKVISFSNEKMNQNTFVNGLNEITGFKLFTSDNKYEIKADYSENSIWDLTRFPKKISVSGTLNKQKFNLNIDISKAVFNVPVNITPANKTNLTRGSLEQLLQK